MHIIILKKTNCKNITRARLRFQEITDSDIKTNDITWQDFQARQTETF